MFGCLVLGLYGLIRRFPRRWWLILAVPAAIALVAYGLVEPHLPRLYYDIKPLAVSEGTREKDIQQRLERVCRAGNVSVSSIKVIHTSRTTRAMNAYLTGLGSRRELILYDTLLNRATPDEIEVVVAHEVGHEKRRNDLLTYGLSAGALLLLLGFLATVLRWGGRFMKLAQGAGSVGTLPLLGFSLWLIFTLVQPVVAWRTRREERAADRTALVLTGNPDAFIRLQVRLARQNRSDIHPPEWVRFWLSSHPSTYERIGRARWYRSWLKRRGVGATPAR